MWLVLAVAVAIRSEVREMPGQRKEAVLASPIPTVAPPQSWSWGDVNGTSYLTKNLNQHLPQYCGSCWAHAALSSLADRIKIARRAQGVEINLAVQWVLNCGGEQAGSCLGGSQLGTYEFIYDRGFVPFDTCLAYEACSSDSSEPGCTAKTWTCSSTNTCRTCSTFNAACSPITAFPNASIAEFARVTGHEAMAVEVFARGPVACSVNADPLLHYTGGVLDLPRASRTVNHVVSIVGFADDHWIVRNSWGEYWGERGFFRVKRGENQLGIESDCAWAVPGQWTRRNEPCGEDGCATQAVR